MTEQQELIEMFSKSLASRVRVENEMWGIVAGKAPLPDAAKVKDWAQRLGIPEETRSRLVQEVK